MEFRPGRNRAISHICQRVRSGSFRHVDLKRPLLEKNQIIRLGINSPKGLDNVLADEHTHVVRSDAGKGFVAKEGIIVAGVGISLGKKRVCFNVFGQCLTLRISLFLND